MTVLQTLPKLVNRGMVSCTAKTVDDGALRDAIKPTYFTKELFYFQNVI